MNSTPVGATTASTGSFTTLRTTGVITLAAPGSYILCNATGFIVNNAADTANRFVVLDGGSAFLNDISNVDVTMGLTINQGTSSDSILALKQSNVAHGMTSRVETDTYATFGQSNVDNGGLSIQAFTEAGRAVFITANATSEDSTRSTAAEGYFRLDTRLKSGTTVAAASANTNLLVISNALSAKFIFDSDGDSHEDGTGWTAYDHVDDLAVLDRMDKTLDVRIRDPLREETGAWLKESKDILQRLRIVSFNDDTDGVPFVNRSRHAMLLTGAVRQLGRHQEQTREELLAEIAQLRPLVERVAKLEHRLTLQ
jgi:hypothetical protein